MLRSAFSIFSLVVGLVSCQLLKTKIVTADGLVQENRPLQPSLCESTSIGEKPAASSGRWLWIDSFASDYIEPRPMEIWLPPGYDSSSVQRYSLIIAHDGQNLFRDSAAFKGISWRLGRVLDSLYFIGAIEPAIVIAPWNGGQLRFAEYVPDFPPYLDQAGALDYLRFRTKQDSVLSKRYQSFLANELLPWARARFRIKDGKEAVTVMGSSMGGLSSLYACAMHPELFGNAICMSTAWATKPQGTGKRMIEWLSEHLPNPEDHRLYFDYGTKGLDSLYEPFQLELDDYLRIRGYRSNDNWLTQRFQDADHHEVAWGHRVAIPLSFILRKR